VRKPADSRRRPTISIVGPGNLGTALGVALTATGYTVTGIAVRRKTARASALARQLKTRAVVMGKRPLDSDIVWITVPDDAIAAVARTLASSQDWRRKIVFHSSGALTSDELDTLRARGASVAAVHPMMTFVRDALPQMAGVSFALEGDPAAIRAARRIVENLGGRPFGITKQNKVLYHVFGSFASPLVIALMATLEEVAQAAGIRKADIKPVMTPLLWQTLRNYLKHDAETAFSGPLVRGDVATVRRHLRELQKLPHAREVYVALAKAAVKKLRVKKREPLKAELDQFN